MKKAILITFVISLVAAYFGMRFGALVAMQTKFFYGLLFAYEQIIPELLSSPILFDTSPFALSGASIGFLTIWMAFGICLSRPKSFRHGEEHGSAKWGSITQGKAFMDTKNADNNVLLTQHYGLRIHRKKFDLQHDRNLNVLVVGGSGSGKTRYVVKPNLLQLNSSYVVFDPKGTGLLETGHLFAKEGYNIRSINTRNFSQSNKYNPLHYVQTDAQILSFTTCLMNNTEGKKNSTGDPFWDKAERLLYHSLIAFLRDWMPEEDYNLPSLVYLLSLAQVKEEDEDFKSPLDLLFQQIETGKRYVMTSTKENEDTYDEKHRGLRPSSCCESWSWQPSLLVNNRTGVKPGEIGGLRPDQDFALAKYKEFKTGAGKTLKSIIISCLARLEALDISELQEMLGGSDELYLDHLGDADQKTILYVITSDTDRTFSFITAILVWQAVNILCDRALDIYNGRLPQPVQFILDEFANIGTLPDIDRTIAVARSRNIFIMILLQSLSQLSARYDEATSKVIQDCCDTLLFLGGKSNETNKALSDAMGQQTIDQLTFNQSYGKQSSHTKNFQRQSRALMDAAEVGRLPRDQALVLIAGTDPLKDKKYPLERHKRYRFIDPGHKGAVYDCPFDFNQYRKEANKEGD